MFQRVTRKNIAPKIALQGVSGSGKTFSALRFARGYVGAEGRIAVIDTENGSASLYSNVTDFDVVNIRPKQRGETISFWWADFEEAISAAEKENYDFLIIDSASHIWQATLDFKARLDKQGGNSFTNWGSAGLQFSAVQNRILQTSLPVLCCFRTKVEYVLEENEKGKQAPRKVGFAPITRGDAEYDFSIVFDVGRNHEATVSKTRCSAFGDDFNQIITEETGRTLRNWIDELQ
ncbi:MAG: AAA family ATPase [Thermoguttaceae bacterium]|nr:AAA family ATPase [Thermoguttaceae bacterium]